MIQRKRDRGRLTPHLRLVLVGALLTAACSDADEPPAEEAPATLAEDLRTGDPYARGYTDADFPRVQEIADGVYTYEQLRAAGSEMFTTVRLFVVTSEGVLVADGQGSVEETELLVRTIAGITNRPITHVVIASDHGDHTVLVAPTS